MQTVLETEAEFRAEEALNIPGFKDFSLRGIKDRVARVLHMIGRIESIFSTYTMHDISHVNAMLKMLEWLIPPSTKEAMTTVDWLMIVLAIYMHDLGMVVTSEEYLKRAENPQFLEFLGDLGKEDYGRDYLARTEKMTQEERERFFYQEYIREKHPVRIKEWITGRHASYWGNTLEPIVYEMEEIFKNLPRRFRENLASVCESHHENNLDRTDYFPLFQRYSSGNIGANVQFAALILRTADLLHVTGDRTPSIMYKTLNLSDPKGTDEWKKQQDTFSVGPKSRNFDAKDIDAHIILVGADLNEERPYFTLSEYIAYADEQIKQSKRWADISQNTSDGKLYSFPWHSVKGDIRVEGHEPFPMRFELDRGKLLNLLVGHTIYNKPTIAVRELLQNAIDAVRYQSYLDKKDPQHQDQYRVLVRWNPETRELVIEDNGIGMDLDTINFHLMRVGSSFYDTPQFNDEHKDFTPISKFGIGILTCFMVSDDIEIVTYRQSKGYRIRMTSVQTEYLLKQLERGHPTLDGLEPHGTRVKLNLRNSVDLSQESILDILRFWIILPACNVFYQEKGLEPQIIGFDSPQDALHYYHFQQHPDEEASYAFKSDKIQSFIPIGEGENIGYEILNNSYRPAGGGIYEIAFAVDMNFFPEKNLTRNRNNNAPVVCVEGIRVSNALPGWGGTYWSGLSLGGTPFCALLSVRGNKKFRTTVSRSDLEEDEEYFKVAKICGDLLFSHLRSEVQRISNQVGRPLSQASTAGRWIFDTISEGVSDEQLSQHLSKLHKKLPLIVVEEIDVRDNEIETHRELVSPENVENMDSFWTIEARLADYLGIISRDLGRELSLNSFLTALAPELRDTRITPVITDAHIFKHLISSTHEVEMGEFSIKHQQAILKWRKKTEHHQEYSEINLTNKADKLLAEVPEIATHRNLREISIELIEGDRRTPDFFVAPVKGDSAKLFSIHTRTTSVIDPETEIAKTYTILKQAVVKGISAKMQIKDLIILLLGRLTLEFYLRWLSQGMYKLATEEERVLYAERDSSPSIQRVFALWKAIAEKINALLKEMQFTEQVDRRLESVVIDGWFDASLYWRKWMEEEE